MAEQNKEATKMKNHAHYVEIIDRDYGDTPITRADFENNPIGIRGSVRMALGRIITPEEIEQLRKKNDEIDYP